LESKGGGDSCGGIITISSSGIGEMEFKGAICGFGRNGFKKQNPQIKLIRLQEKSSLLGFGSSSWHLHFSGGSTHLLKISWPVVPR
jgi:hypothetical protein